MIRGHIQLEDHIIDFDTRHDNGTVTYTITDLFENEQETCVVDQASFFKALAIAVHNDGMPDYKVDYPAAESAQGKIRWIP